MPDEKRYCCNGFVNRISFRAPTKFEQRNPGLGNQFFDTWAEAHSWLLQLRAKDVKDAQRQLVNARMGLKRAREMKPSPPDTGGT